MVLSGYFVLPLVLSGYLVLPLVLRGYFVLPLVLRGYFVLPLVLREYLLLTGPAMVGPATGSLEPVLPVPVLPTRGGPPLEPGPCWAWAGSRALLGERGTLGLGRSMLGGRGRGLPIGWVWAIMGGLLGSGPWAAASGVPGAVEFGRTGGIGVPSGRGAMPAAWGSGAAWMREGVVERWRRRRKKGKGGRCIAGDGLLEMIMVEQMGWLVPR